MNELKNGKTLLAGPWVGEFGWELFCWQGYVRNLSESYENTIVMSRPGNDFIYKDFAKKYIPFDPLSWDTSMNVCYNVKKDIGSFVRSVIDSVGGIDFYLEGNLGIPFKLEQDWFDKREGIFFQQKYHKYNFTEEVKKIDILMHPRNKVSGHMRNWPEWKWNKLVENLKNDFSIGIIGNEQAFCLKNTEDLRKISLESLCNYIHQSKIVVGPSSGPMHFASLCGKKHLVWSERDNKIRYEKIWNPFNTEVVFVDEGNWDPSVELIEEKIRKSLYD